MEEMLIFGEMEVGDMVRVGCEGRRMEGWKDECVGGFDRFILDI